MFYQIDQTSRFLGFAHIEKYWFECPKKNEEHSLWLRMYVNKLFKSSQ